MFGVQGSGVRVQGSGFRVGSWVIDFLPCLWIHRCVCIDVMCVENRVLFAVFLPPCVCVCGYVCVSVYVCEERRTMY